jgi:hypothetical protein
MAKRLQHRGGTTSQHSSFTGAVREVTVDTDKNTLVVHDGATAGGHPLATATNFKSTGIDDNATSTAITINSSEQVGIGTASPSEILHIEGNSPYLVISNTGENVGGIKMYDSADSGGQYFHLTYDSASSNEVSFDTGASGEYTFNVNTAEKMRIDSSGNLGIGTASPSSKLDIYNGGINVDTTGGTLTATRYNSGSGSSLILLQKSQSATIGTQSALSNGYGIGGIITKGSDGTSFINTTAISSEVDGTVSTNSVPSRITFSTNSGSTSYSERMRINSSGNVGIGTTNPTAKLQVEGTFSVRSSSTQSFNDSVNANNLTMTNSKAHFNVDGADKDFQVSSDTVPNALFVQGSDGNVGIGTSSPTYSLQVYKATAGNIVRLGSTRTLDISNSDNGTYLGAIWNRNINSVGGIHTWSINGSERMRIDSSGNVGINTTNTDTKFSLESPAKISRSAATTVDASNLTNKFELLKFTLAYGFQPPAMITGTLMVSVINSRTSFNGQFGFRSTHIDFTFCSGIGYASNGLEVLQAINTLSNSAVNATHSPGRLTALTVTAEVSYDGGSTFGTSFGVASNTSSPAPIVRLVANTTRSNTDASRLGLNYTATYSYNDLCGGGTASPVLLSDAITNVT